MEEQWSLAHLLGYLHTWSATARYADDKGTDPVAALEERLRSYGLIHRVLDESRGRWLCAWVASGDVAMRLANGVPVDDADG
jgi:hypothetical protein